MLTSIYLCYFICGHSTSQQDNCVSTASERPLAILPCPEMYPCNECGERTVAALAPKSEPGALGGWSLKLIPEL
jgi:hypothetical protein